MSLFKFKYCLFIVILLSFLSGKAQDASFVIPDSLKAISYDGLLKKYKNVYKDTTKSKIYLNSAYEIAEKDNDEFRKSRALANLSLYMDNRESREELLDLSIYHAKKSKSKDYLMQCYSFYGGYHLSFFEYQKALDFYLKSLSVAQEYDNQDYIYINKHNIASIKSEIGNYKEALDLFKECYDREVRIGEESFIYDYLETTLYLAETYIRMNQPDSAAFYIKQAKKKDNSSYPNITSTLKVYEYISKSNHNTFEYNQILLTLDDLGKNQKNSQRNFLIGHYYTALINKNNNVKHFKIIDSIFQEKKILVPEVRMAYENLIRYHKKEKDSKNQLQYVDKLLKFDSLFFKQKQILGAKISSLYDTPTLVAEKELLIEKLNKKNSSLSYGSLILLIFTFILLSIVVYFTRRTKNLKIKFNNIINTQETTHKIINPTLDKSEKIIKKTKKELDIPEKIISEILNKLITFENENLFVRKSISSSSLAKKLGTNSKYLSKIINHYKKKTLTTYVNDLRIEYFIKEVKTNPKLINYTIQSIAEEVGFNTAESFSNAFYKKTGLKPSYFIKKLKNK